MNKIQLLTQDIEKSFKKLSSLTLVSVAGSLLFALVVGVYALTFAEKQRQKIYVLDQGKSLLLALQTDAVMSKDVEIAYRTFHIDSKSITRPSTSLCFEGCAKYHGHYFCLFEEVFLDTIRNSCSHIFAISSGREKRNERQKLFDTFGLYAG